MMSLRDLCLGKIVDEFKRYNFAFITSKDENLLMKLEFLQRMYSLKIIIMLNDGYKLEEEFLDFLINKHLKVLHTEWFSFSSWGKISAKFSAIGPSLEKLHFSEIDLPWHDVFCHFQNLKVISFLGNCSDDYLKCIAKYCTHVQELDIRCSFDVSNCGIQYLCNDYVEPIPACPSLKKICLQDTCVSDDGVKLLLKYFHKLEEIDYQRLPQVLFSVHEKDLSALDKIQAYNITHLDLLHCAKEKKLTEIITVCVSVCPHLKSFSCPLLSQEHLDLCSQLSKIEILHLEYWADLPLEIKDFLKLKGAKLTSLTLRNFKISVSDLAQKCHCLKKLSLNKVCFKPFNDKAIPLFTNLEFCEFENADLTEALTIDSVCKVLASSPQLDELRIPKCTSIPSEIKNQILKCCEQCSLTQLHFNNSVVEKELLRQILLTCSTLEVLNIDGCDFEDSFVEDLSNIALSLPNHPEVIATDDQSYESNDEFFDEYDDYFDTDDDVDADSDYYLDYGDDDYDVDYYDSNIF